MAAGLSLVDVGVLLLGLFSMHLRMTGAYRPSQVHFPYLDF